jgi:hypothetical protein
VGGTNPDEASQIGIGLCRLDCFVGAGATSQRRSRLLAMTTQAIGEFRVRLPGSPIELRNGRDDPGTCPPISVATLMSSDYLNTLIEKAP